MTQPTAPSSGTTRRELLRRTAFGLAGAAAAGALAPLASALAPRPFPLARPAPLFTISLAQWSLHRQLYGGKLDHLDFPKKAKEAFGIDAVEYVNSFFKEKGSATYDAELKKRCDDLGVTSVLIMCDGEGALGDADEKKRAKAVENHKKWLETAQRLGCRAIRVNAQSAGSYEEQRDRAADGLRRLCETAKPFGLYVIVENHGGLSSNGAWLAETIKKTDHPLAGTLPDFGNFRLGDGKEYDRYLGVKELMPFARGVSAKSYAFDEKGDEKAMDFRRLLRTVVDAGYAGRVGIEYEGDAHSEDDGVKLTKALLERVRDELAKERAASRPSGG